MDKAQNHPHIVAEKLERGVTDPQSTLLERMRHIARSNIARTALTVSAAVSSILGHAPETEARSACTTVTKGRLKPKLHTEKAPQKPIPKYQNFPHGSAKLEIIEGARLTALEGVREEAKKLSPLSAKDLPKIKAQCEFYDPWNSGTPLVKIKRNDLEKNVSPHFKVKDMVRIDTKDLYLVKSGFYQKYNGEYFRTVARIDPELVKMLEQVYEKMQSKKKNTVRLHTNEGYRPYGENARTYWRKCRGNAACTHENSPHTSGRGVDIDRKPGLQDICIEVVKTRGSGGIGTHGINIVHLDSRPGTIKMWDYGHGKGKANEPRREPEKKGIIGRTLEKIKGAIAEKLSRK